MERTYAEPIGESAGWSLPWRALAAAALLSAVLGAALSAGLAGRSDSVLPAARSGVSATTTLSRLPAAEQGSISAALGAADHSYWVGAAAGGYHALSSSQALHTRFTRSGVSLDGGAVQLGLSLRAAGYGRSLKALDGVTPSVTANRVTYAHAGLTEWYVNGPQGLEQGFTVPRPSTTGSAGALTLSMALSGDAHAAVSDGGQSAVFKRGASTLRYSGLTATDANGRTLRSSMKLGAGRLNLSVDTRGARYPVTVDPLVAVGEKLTADEESKSLAGFRVALSADGNTALVGAPRDHNFAGAALVFTRIASGATTTWSKPVVLVGSEQTGSEETCATEAEEEESSEPGCGFGTSVALSADGNTALIGGQRDNGYAGAAWAFTRSGSTWSQQGAKIVGDCTSSCSGPSGTGETGSGHFGHSVALSGDGNTALIGAPGDHLGAVWVFTRSGSTWSEQGSKIAGGEGAGSGEGHYFGASVALSGDGNTALIGDPGDSTATGAAWVFGRAGSTWSQQGGKLLGGSEESGEGRFGFSVAVSADASTALIGARNDNAGVGAAWALTRSGSSWIHLGAKLTGGEEANGVPKFGYSVALSETGTTALVGGRGDAGHRGAVWQFTRSGPSFTQQEGKLTGGEKEVGTGGFGTSVALSANAETALVGGPTDNGSVGAAWAFADLPVPTVTSINPNEGTSAGGTVVDITGTKLDTAESVRFGSSPESRQALSFTINSPTSITAVAPRGSGRADVIVHNSFGDSRTSQRDLFTWVSLGGRGLRPVVTSVVPNHGPTTGGTTVTITGANLDEASAVKFGHAPAARFTAISSTLLTAVSPPGAPETVSVTVTTPVSTSAASSNAQFTFETPTSGAATGLTGSAGSSGGVLGFGPFVVSSCTVSLRGKTLAVQRYKQASVKLSWAGIGTCSGRLKLTFKQKVSHPKRGHKRFTIKTIGTGSFSIAPGAVRTVRVNLNKLGRSLLKARHGRLNASIAITKLLPGPLQARTASVRLALQKTRKAKKHTK
jgi:hypothetical protein